MTSRPESSGWRRFLPSPSDETESAKPSSNAHAGQSVLVTGAAGYIGSALVRAIAAARPGRIILLDCSEQNLLNLEGDLESVFPELACSVVFGSIQDTDLLDDVFTSHRPEVVYHAAAFKHVPLLEYNPVAAVRNNAIGSWTVAQAALRHGVSRFILLSTDKAVNPHSIMGASKRIAELAIAGLSTPECRMNAIRLVNVIGSPGSVVPLFLQQIADGGPVSVTHPEATRWFLSLPEAVSAILACGNAACDGRILVPEVGEPVRIAELARFLISSEADHDIPITFAGLRPGEKLTEELVGANETEEAVAGGLRIVRTPELACTRLEVSIERLSSRIDANDVSGLIHEVSAIVPEYVPGKLLR